MKTETILENFWDEMFSEWSSGHFEKNFEEIKIDVITKYTKLLTSQEKPTSKEQEPKHLTCVDCGKQNETVKYRGSFSGTICYECKKEQDIVDEECR